MNSSGCYLCTVSSVVLEHNGVRDDPNLTVYRCQDCGLVFLWPRTEADRLNAFYASGEYRQAYDPGATLEERHRMGLEEAQTRIRRLGAGLQPDSVVCDVGAGAGSFVSLVKPLVHRIVAVEPERAAQCWILNRLGVEALPDVDALLPASFHLITLFHVLEHTENPISFLRTLADRLAPGGHLVIEVPNVRDALLSMYGVSAFADFYFQKAHLWYFNADTLGQVLERAGLDANITFVQRYDLSNHLRWALTRDPGGQGCYRDVLGDEVADSYARALMRNGVADTLWAVASPAAAHPRAADGNTP